MPVEILSTNGFTILVDDEDAPKVKNMPWHVRFDGCNYYAGKLKMRGDRRTFQMHRFIMDVPQGFVVDHINGNGLDNRKCNLRVCSHSENLRNRTRNNKNNTSGFRGVTWHKATMKWRSRICVDGQDICTGYFDDIAEAIQSRLDAEKTFFGEFAPRYGRTDETV